MAKKRKSVAKEESKPKPKIQKSLLSSSDDDDEESESEEESDEEVEVEEEKEENESSESSEEEEEEEENEDSKLENIKELLEPFSKEQLLTILKEAAQSSPAITAGIVSVAESDPVHRKIFVHSLGWDCTNETLIAAFKPFGVIEECNVITDKTTGRSKGYGFVLFQNRTAARKALKQPQKKIGNRFAACQLASTRPIQNQNENQNQYQQQHCSDVSARKLYVANVGPQIRPEKLRAFFAKFGEIEDGPLGFDKVTGKFRGFAIIIYRTLDGIKKALEEPFKVFDGVKLQCSIGRSAKNNNNAATGQTPRGQTPVDTGANAMVIPGLALGLNPGPIFLGQNPAALGVLNPMLGVATGPYAGGVSQPVNSVGNAAIPGFGVQPGISSVSPNVMGGYGSQAAPLQGLGVYPSYQFGQPSSSVTGAAARPQTGTGPYFGR